MSDKIRIDHLVQQTLELAPAVRNAFVHGQCAEDTALLLRRVVALGIVEAGTRLAIATMEPSAQPVSRVHLRRALALLSQIGAPEVDQDRLARRIEALESFP